MKQATRDKLYLAAFWILIVVTCVALTYFGVFAWIDAVAHMFVPFGSF